MRGLPKQEAFVFGIVTSICILIGWIGITVGVPMTHADYASHPVVPYASFLQPAAFWGICSLAVYGAALVRARSLDERDLQTPGTLWRGSIWLWGVMGTSWFYFWIRADVINYDVYEEPPLGHVPPFALDVAYVWMLGAFFCIVIAPVWSVVTGIVMARTGETATFKPRANGVRWRTRLRTLAGRIAPIRDGSLPHRHWAGESVVGVGLSLAGRPRRTTNSYWLDARLRRR